MIDPLTAIKVELKAAALADRPVIAVRITPRALPGSIVALPIDPDRSAVPPSSLPLEVLVHPADAELMRLEAAAALGVDELIALDSVYGYPVVYPSPTQ